MTDDLVKRLRIVAADFRQPLFPEKAAEAADLIEAQKAEIERLMNQVNSVTLNSMTQIAKCEVLERELERRNTDSIHTCSDVCQRPGCVQRRGIERLKAALVHVGDAICDVIEQMLKGSWRDDNQHLVTNNTAMLQLKDSLTVARKALEAK